MDCLRTGYRGADFLADLGAGLTVGVVALPLAMAFAIASGVPPASGIYTAIVAGFIISALGGSRVQIGGPTGAYIVVVYSIVARYGVANLMICTLAAGVLLLAMGMLRLGGLIRFIPVSIVIGFTNGIAVLILLSQVKDLLGLSLALPDEFFTRVHALAVHSPQANPLALAVGAGAIGLLLAWPRQITTEGQALQAEAAGSRAGDPALVHAARRGGAVLLRTPGPIAVLVLASVACAWLHVDVETIGTRFGGIPTGLPPLVAPSITLAALRDLIAPTITIALLGAIESLLSARVADSMIGDRHDPNQELMAQGIANIASPFFGGIPATGAIARTATNVRTGARTPIAGVIHALTLLGIVLVAAPLARYVPLPALAAVLVVVALNMGDWKAFAELRRYSIPYRVVLLTTFVVTVVFDLSTAVELGLVLASLFFIYRVSDLTQVQPVDTGDPSVAAYRLFGALFFGSVARLEPLLEPRAPPLRAMVLDLHQVISLDNTALEVLSEVHRRMAERGGTLVLSGLNAHPEAQIRRSPLAAALGETAILPSLDVALAYARARARDATGPP